MYVVSPRVCVRVRVRARVPSARRATFHFAMHFAAKCTVPLLPTPLAITLAGMYDLAQRTRSARVWAAGQQRALQRQQHQQLAARLVADSSPHVYHHPLLAELGPSGLDRGHRAAP